MKNFFQSQIWRAINQKVYQKPIFEIELLGKKYFGTIKEKSKIGLTLRWYQVLGLEIGFDLEEKSDILIEEIKRIKRDYKNSFKDIFFQIGIIDQIDRFETNSLKNVDFAQSIKNKREHCKKYMLDNYQLPASFRENMPLATIDFDLSKGKDQLFKEIRKSSRAHIRKATNKGLQLEIATKEDFLDFYNVWHLTSYNKGFHIIGKNTYNTLMSFLYENNYGKLFLAKFNGEIVSGSICILHNSNIIYLYGATNRKFGNMGGHQFLKNEIFKWGFDNSYNKVDLFGAAPSGYENHHLKGVSRFKESLGGSKSEYLGNYDIIFNKTFYEGFKMIKR